MFVGLKVVMKRGANVVGMVRQSKSLEDVAKKNSTVKVIIFDFAGVISNNPAFLHKVIAKRFGLDENFVYNEISRFIKRLQKGTIRNEEFWEKLAKRLGINKKELKRVWLEAYEKYSKVDKRMIRLIKKLRRKYKLCLFSNTTKFHARTKFRKKVAKLFDYVAYSCFLGYKKPERKSFEKVLKRLRVKPEECLFIDDQEENVKMAKRVGMKAIKFEGYEKLVTFLSTLDSSYRSGIFRYN